MLRLGIRLFIVTILTFVIYSCGSKPIRPDLSGEALLSKIKTENPHQCSMKRKGVFSLENRFNKTKFKGYIHKKCDNSFKLNILGLFNQIAYKVIFVEGKLDVFEADKNISKDVPFILTAEEVAKMSGLLNIPLVVPNHDFTLSNKSDATFIFKHSQGDVFVDKETYKVVKVTDQNMSIEYQYQSNRLSSIRYLDFSHNIHITFLK